MRTIPAFANCHSHAFHRALRGRVASADSFTASDFWQWRDQMYAIAGVLDPDLLFDLARATYAEMHLAGIRSVGEFHYVHHQPNGEAYDDPNAMAEALIAAGRYEELRLWIVFICLF
jgi:cytosine/adenosine deaminase-related metal-dependent hydrolase